MSWKLQIKNKDKVTTVNSETLFDDCLDWCEDHLFEIAAVTTGIIFGAAAFSGIKRKIKKKKVVKPAPVPTPEPVMTKFDTMIYACNKLQEAFPDANISLKVGSQEIHTF